MQKAKIKTMRKGSKTKSEVEKTEMYILREKKVGWGTYIDR